LPPHGVARKLHSAAAGAERAVADRPAENGAMFADRERPLSISGWTNTTRRFFVEEYLGVGCPIANRLGRIFVAQPGDYDRRKERRNHGGDAPGIAAISRSRSSMV